MPSDKQLAANRANASRSTGPRTLEGKARSARNARKHGFAGANFAILKTEDRDAVDRLRQDLAALYQPINSQEIFAVERIAHAQHTLRCLARLETGLRSVALNRALLNFENEDPFALLLDDRQLSADDAKRLPLNVESFATWGLFLRYQAQAERNYRRAVEDFERLKMLRSPTRSQNGTS